MPKHKRNREDAVVRRAQIIDQALRIVGELGYYGFTIQALADRCGISNAGLLHYFGSKDKVLLALLDEIERRSEIGIAHLVAAAIHDSQSREHAHAAVVTLLQEMVAQFLGDVTQARFVAALQLESMNEAHPAHTWFRNREAETIDLFAQLARPWTEEPLSTARQLYGLMTGLGQQWLRSGDTFDLNAEWNRALRLILPEPKSL